MRKYRTMPADDSTPKGLIQGVKEELLCSPIGDFALAMILAGSFLWFLGDLRSDLLVPILANISGVRTGNSVLSGGVSEFGIHTLRIVASAIQVLISLVLVFYVHRWAHSTALMSSNDLTDNLTEIPVEENPDVQRDLGSLGAELAAEEAAQRQ